MKKQWLRYGVLEVLLLIALYVLPRFWRRYIPEMLEQGRSEEHTSELQSLA